MCEEIDRVPFFWISLMSFTGLGMTAIPGTGPAKISLNTLTTPQASTAPYHPPAQKAKLSSITTTPQTSNRNSLRESSVSSTLLPGIQSS